MPYLDKVTTEINNYLKAGVLNRHSLQGGIYHGLASQVKVVDAHEKIIPAIIDNNGNDIDVTIDDVSPIHVYHRLVAPIQFPSATNENKFGDGGQVVVEVSSMSCIVFSNPKKTGLSSEDLGFLMASGLPNYFTLSQIGSSDVSSCRIILQNIDTNQYNVMSREYGASIKTIPIDKTLMAINYQIEMVVDKNCMVCENC